MFCAIALRRLCHRASYDARITCCTTAPSARRACSQILDAPKLRDDFYMNVLDWSSQNLLAVGLGDSVYLWNAVNNNVRSLLWAHASLASLGMPDRTANLMSNRVFALQDSLHPLAVHNCS